MSSPSARGSRRGLPKVYHRRARRPGTWAGNRTGGLFAAGVLALALAADPSAAATRLGREHLEALLELPPRDLPHALPEEPVLVGPIQQLAVAEDGLYVVGLRALSKLDETGRTRWRVEIPEGIQRFATPRSGRWIAGHSTRVTADLTRETRDWLVDGRTGELTVLARDRHPMRSRRTDRRLLAWDPLPFAPGTDEGDLAEAGVLEALAEDAARADPVEDEAAPGEAPGLGYQRAEFSRDFLLEEGLLVFRTTHFTETGRSWWSLHHVQPETAQSTKLCDGTPAFSAEELSSLGPDPATRDRFLLRRRGGWSTLDPITCRLEPAPAVREAPGEELDEGSGTWTVSEVYYLEAGDGLVLVHPEGRRSLALRGQRLRQLVRYPESSVFFALAEAEKSSLLGDDTRRTLYRIDLASGPTNLAAYQAQRADQERLNEALTLLERLENSPLEEARQRLQELEALLPMSGGGSLARQAQVVRVRARTALAQAYGKAGKIGPGRQLVVGLEHPMMAAVLLELAVRASPATLARDLESVGARPELWRDQPEVQVALARAHAARGDLAAALGWLERAAEEQRRSQALAALAVHVGDQAFQGAAPRLAAKAYAQAHRLKPSSDAALAKLGRALLAADEPCAAATALADAPARDPGGEPTGLRATLFRAVEACGELGRARHLLDGLRLDHPLDPTYLEWDADLAVAEGQVRRALPMLRALERLRPDDARLRNKREALEARLAGPNPRTR